MIQTEAVKCRYCREFLEDPDILPVSRHAVRPGAQKVGVGQETDPVDADEESPTILTPSLWAMTDSAWKGACILAVAIFVLALPIERWVLVFKGLSDSAIRGMAQTINLAAEGTIVVVLVWLGLRAAFLRSIHYEISPDRIEWARGLFSREIDNIDMFRVIDIKLHRSILDCITGVGTVTVMTKDDSDPTFQFEKVRNPRRLYDAIKHATLEADRRQGVVHIE